MRATWVLKPKRRVPDRRPVDTKPVRHRKRATSRYEEDYSRVTEAAKRRAMKRKVERKPTGFPFVYVGNLKPAISEQKLNEMFRTCGKIVGIKLRCSRGQVVPAPDPSEDPTSRLYASVAFFEAEAAKLALAMNGTIVDGMHIVVTTTPADLPEVQDIISARTAPKQKSPFQLRREPKFRAEPTFIIEQPELRR